MIYEILQVIYFLVPVAFANMAPVLVRKHFPSLAKPLDFGTGILGPHKTFRGLLFGIIGGILGVLLQYILFMNYAVQTFSLVNYEKINLFLFGFLIGVGVIVGDAVGSFIKRRLKMKPGASFVPLDQIVAPLGAMLFILPLYRVSLKILLLALIVSIVFHILIKHIGYFLKIENKKW